MAKIILLNGPPHCGKDTAAKFIKEHLGRTTEIHKFAGPLKYITSAFAEYMGDMHSNVLSDEPNVKNSPNKYLLGKSPREFQISISEDWMKQLYGESVFGEILANRIMSIPDWQSRAFIVSDSGFRLEAEELIKAFGANNILLIRLHRTNCNFSIDSRSYIELADLNVTEVDIENNSSLSSLRECLVKTIKHWR